MHRSYRHVVEPIKTLAKIVKIMVLILILEEVALCGKVIQFSWGIRGFGAKAKLTKFKLHTLLCLIFRWGRIKYISKKLSRSLKIEVGLGHFVITIK